MALHSELPIYKASYDLLGIATDLVRNLPRDIKPSIIKHVKLPSPQHPTPASPRSRLRYERIFQMKIIEMLRDALDYCPNTGIFTWRVRPPSHFKNAESCARENARHANKAAGSVQTHARAKSYKCVSIQVFNRHYLAHRLAWAFTHGEFPKKDEQIDHINGDATDNRIDNLRLVSMQENNRNKGMGRNNKTGITGVSWKKKYQKWYAFIKVGGVDKHLGCFSTVFDAACARKSAEREHGYHSNHGRRR